jgi:hypothetical protein
MRKSKPTPLPQETLWHAGYFFYWILRAGGSSLIENPLQNHIDIKWGQAIKSLERVKAVGFLQIDFVGSSQRHAFPEVGLMMQHAILFIQCKSNQNKRVTRACEHKYLSLSFNSLTNPNASQFPASHPHSAYSMDCPLPVVDAVPCTVRTSWAWAPCTVAGMQQPLTLHDQHSHPVLCVALKPWRTYQLRGEVCVHPAPPICEKNNQKMIHRKRFTNIQRMQRREAIKNHSHYPLHSHQLHIPQSDIAPRPNVHTAMPSGEVCNLSVTLTFNHIQHTCNNGKVNLIISKWCWKRE